MELEEEDYRTMRQRHDQELKTWLDRTLAGGISITAASKRTGVNPGTIWRIVRRFKRGESDS